MKTKNSALAALISAGFNAELNAAGLRVWGDNWEAQFTDLGQDHDIFAGDVPAQVHELAVWDDASTRGEAQAIEQALHTPQGKGGSMIQKVTFEGGIFSRGSFALHKITGDFSGKCSAWFSTDGKLYDCEWIRRDGVQRSIPPRSPMFRYLESLGPIWK